MSHASASRRSAVRSVLLAAALVLPCLSAGAQAPSEEEPVVAGAADLRFALEEIASAFHADTGETVKACDGFVRQFRTADPPRGAVRDVPLRRTRTMCSTSPATASRAMMGRSTRWGGSF